MEDLKKDKEVPESEEISRLRSENIQINKELQVYGNENFEDRSESSLIHTLDATTNISRNHTCKEEINSPDVKQESTGSGRNSVNEKSSEDMTGQQGPLKKHSWVTSLHLPDPNVSKPVIPTSKKLSMHPKTSGGHKRTSSWPIGTSELFVEHTSESPTVPAPSQWNGALNWDTDSDDGLSLEEARTNTNFGLQHSPTEEGKDDMVSHILSMMASDQKELMSIIDSNHSPSSTPGDKQAPATSSGNFDVQQEVPVSPISNTSATGLMVGTATPLLIPSLEEVLPSANEPETAAKLAVSVPATSQSPAKLMLDIASPLSPKVESTNLFTPMLEVPSLPDLPLGEEFVPLGVAAEKHLAKKQQPSTTLEQLPMQGLNETKEQAREEQSRTITTTYLKTSKSPETRTGGSSQQTPAHEASAHAQSPKSESSPGSWHDDGYDYSPDQDKDNESPELKLTIPSHSPPTVDSGSSCSFNDWLPEETKTQDWNTSGPRFEPLSGEKSDLFVSDTDDNESCSERILFDSPASENPSAIEGDDWVQCSTPEGDMYFYNTNTGESQWEIPRNSVLYRSLHEEKEEPYQENVKASVGPSVQSPAMEHTLLEAQSNSSPALHTQEKPLGRKQRPVKTGTTQQMDLSDPNTTNSQGESALHLVAKLCFLQGLEFLLRAGAHPSAQDHRKKTPLHCAAMGTGSDTPQACIQLLLDYGADPNLPDSDGNTALHLASQAGRSEVVMVLVQGGASTTTVNRAGNSPLHLAAIYGHLECMQALVLVESSPATSAGSKKHLHGRRVRVGSTPSAVKSFGKHALKNSRSAYSLATSGPAASPRSSFSTNQRDAMLTSTDGGISPSTSEAGSIGTANESQMSYNSEDELAGECLVATPVLRDFEQEDRRSLSMGVAGRQEWHYNPYSTLHNPKEVEYQHQENEQQQEPRTSVHWSISQNSTDGTIEKTSSLEELTAADSPSPENPRLSESTSEYVSTAACSLDGSNSSGGKKSPSDIYARVQALDSPLSTENPSPDTSVEKSSLLNSASLPSFIASSSMPQHLQQQTPDETERQIIDLEKPLQTEDFSTAAEYSVHTEQAFYDTQEEFKEETIEGWVQYLTDEGVVYYYNTITQVSSWDAPPEWNYGYSSYNQAAWTSGEEENSLAVYPRNDKQSGDNMYSESASSTGRSYNEAGSELQESFEPAEGFDTGVAAEFFLPRPSTVSNNRNHSFTLHTDGHEGATKADEHELSSRRDDLSGSTYSFQGPVRQQQKVTAELLTTKPADASHPEPTLNRQQVQSSSELEVDIMDSEDLTDPTAGTGHIAVWNRFFKNALLAAERKEAKVQVGLPPVSPPRQTPDVNLGQVQVQSFKPGQHIPWAESMTEGMYQSVLEKALRATSSNAEKALALFHASMRGSYADAEALLAQGVSPNVLDEVLRTPLHHACRHERDKEGRPSPQSHAQLVALMSDVGADLAARDLAGQTATHVAAEYGSTQCLGYLLGSAVNVDASDNSGDTPLHRAVWQGRRDCAELLVEYGANIEATNALGHTPYSNVLVLLESNQHISEELDSTLLFLEEYIGIDRNDALEELEQIFPEMKSRRELILPSKLVSQINNQHTKDSFQHENYLSYHEHISNSIPDQKDLLNLPFVSYAHTTPPPSTYPAAHLQHRYANINLDELHSKKEEAPATPTFWRRMRQTVGGIFASMISSPLESCEMDINESTSMQNHKPPTDEELKEFQIRNQNQTKTTFLEPPDDVKEALRNQRRLGNSLPTKMKPPDDVLKALQLSKLRNTQKERENFPQSPASQDFYTNSLDESNFNV